MKKISSITTAVVLAAILFSFSGCLKDECRSSFKIWIPVYKTLAEVRSAMKSGPAKEVRTTGKIYVYGNYIFLNEPDKGIHVINNTNPSSPQNIGYINIPGNVDIAVKGSYLFADSYSDLVVFDISNPTAVKTEKFVNNVFPNRNRYYFNATSNPDSIKVVVDYVERDTVMNCDDYRSMNSCRGCLNMDRSAGGGVFLSSAPPTGTGGSMARFTIINDYLYTVSTSALTAFNISNATDPQPAQTQMLGWNIETIYPFGNKLFIGSPTGMFIYSIANPSAPSLISQFNHAQSCDPVIADGNYAYVTLRSGTTCNGILNQMEVIDIVNLSNPALQKIIPMTNPHGLGKDGSLMFVCDGKDGLKIYNATDPVNLQLLKTITGLETYDVIMLNNVAIVVAKDGLYQYDYSDRNNIRLISKISRSN
jgi:hypothetical protein